MKKIFILLLATPSLMFSQNVGIGTNSPDVSAQLDITNTAKGILIPRMSTSAITSISSPAKGLMVYDSVKNQLMVNMGNSITPNWQTIIYTSGWSLTGNTGTTPVNNFIGTLDNLALSFRQNNKWTGRLDAVLANYFIGAGSGENNGGVGNGYFGDSTGYISGVSSYSVRIGYKAGKNSTGWWTTIIGADAGQANAAHGNVFLGSASGMKNTSGANNTFVGDNAGRENTTASGNSFFGAFAGVINTGANNSAFGNSALVSNTTGFNNTATGSRALFNNTFGTSNVAIGDSAQYSNQTGSSNTVVGSRAGRNLNSSNNSIFGIEAGYSLTSGTGHCFFGSKAGYSTTANTFNAFFGLLSGYALSSGGANAFFGNSAGNNQATGSYNCYFGQAAAYNKPGGNSSCIIGAFAGQNDASSSPNIFLGFESGFNNAGGSNIAIGNSSAYSNTGNNNSFVGFNAGYNNSGDYNTGVGYAAGNTYNMGWNNTIIGANADLSFNGQFNSIALGNIASCPDNSTVRIGNASNWSYGGYAGWTTLPSDGIYKKNIKQNVAGLDFIMRLRPVTYQMDVTILSKKLNEGRGNELNRAMKTAIAEKEAMVWTGFIAQEVEAAAKESNFDFSGVDKPRNEHGVYGLRYAEFVVPLVKAVQEQQQTIELLKKEIEELKRSIRN